MTSIITSPGAAYIATQGKSQPISPPTHGPWWADAIFLGIIIVLAVVSTGAVLNRFSRLTKQAQQRAAQRPQA